MASCTQEDDPNPVAKRTVLVYLAADNSLGYLGFAQEDLEEMKEGMKSVNPDDLHLLVYIDTGTSPRLVELKRQNDGTVTENIIREYDDGRNSVGLQETIEVFQTAFTARYQAESYGLIYWSHADGWLPYPTSASTRWVGQDTGNGDHRMNISEFVTVLENAAPHLDFILFDACFMSSMEVAYEIRKHTRYIIACPTQNPGPGAPYELIVPLMTKSDAPASIMQTYYNDYAEIYDENRTVTNENWTGGVALTLTETAQVEQLAKVTQELLSTHTAKDYPTNLYRQVYNYDKRYGAYGYYDMAEAMQAILTEEEYATWKAAFDSTFTYLTTPKTYSNGNPNGLYSMEGTCGVTHYLPDTDYSTLQSSYQELMWYTDMNWANLGW